MLKRISIAEFLGCLIDHIEANTGIKCCDDPDNVPSPLYGVQFVRSEPCNTKTAFVDMFEVYVHCISEPVHPYSNAPVLELVEKLEEAMTDDLELPEPFIVQRQVYNGLTELKKDESGEGHAVLGLAFYICYGFRCK